MANLFQTFGVKEVADVTIWESVVGGTYKPVLFFDTLKISTIEQTAEQVQAEGGKGNVPLVIWDLTIVS